jgi:4-amino-4-deoxy-L-arabinose transferase-like glycosyltransferase
LFNAAASYAPGPGVLRVLAAVLGVLLPFLAVRRLAPVRAEEGPRIPLGLTVAILTVGLATRLLHLRDFSAWPLYDEGVAALYALDNVRGWDGRLSHYFSSMPPLYAWLEAILFRILGVGRTALWLLPALLAAAAWLLFADAARRTLPARDALLVLVLSAFGYGMLLPGRVSHPYVLVLFWTCLCLWGAALFREKRLFSRPGWMFLGGAVLGAGTLTFFTWHGALPILSALTAWHFRGELRRREHRVPVAALALGAALACLPQAGVLLRGGFQGHALGLFGGLTDPHRLAERAWHLTALFWTGMDSFRFGPFRGGILNPVESTLFFTGVAASLLDGKGRGWRLVLAAWVLLLLPVLLTWPANGTRLVHLMPFTVLLVVRGCRVLSALRAPRVPVLALLLLSSAVLNLVHLWGPARRWSTQPALWEHQRLGEHAKAFELCEQRTRDSGPGMLFLRLGAAHSDYQALNPALFVLSSPWNRLAWPSPGEGAPAWIAILTNSHHRAYLERRFKGSSWQDLTPEPVFFTGTFSLGFIPPGSWDAGTRAAWTEAERILHGLYRGLLEDAGLEREPEGARRRYVQALEGHAAAFKNDPFLGAVFQESRFAMGVGALDEKPLLGMLSDARRGAYRSPYLLVAEGLWLVRNGRDREAGPLFDEAARDYPPARRYVGSELTR